MLIIFTQTFLPLISFTKPVPLFLRLYKGNPSMFAFVSVCFRELLAALAVFHARTVWVVLSAGTMYHAVADDLV